MQPNEATPLKSAEYTKTTTLDAERALSAEVSFDSAPKNLSTLPKAVFAGSLATLASEGRSSESELEADALGAAEDSGEETDEDDDIEFQRATKGDQHLLSLMGSAFS
jgi:hypothetical protein